MAGGRTVRIQILGDAKGAQGAFGQVESAAGSFASKIGTVAKGVAIGIGAIGVAAGAMAVTGIKAASDYEESWNKVGEVFGQNAGQIQDWSKNAAQSFGLSQSEALAATGTFGNLFTAMGIGSGAAADMSTDIVGLAADLGSFNNIGTDEALEKIRAGLVGETEPLRSLGVNLDAASIAAKAMALGLADSEKNLTPAAKAQAAYALILEQTTTAQGDFARTKSGMANSLKIIGASFDDLKVNIGQRLLPVIAPLISSFASGMPRALDMAGGVLDRISGIVSGPLSRAFGTAKQAISDFIYFFKNDYDEGPSNFFEALGIKAGEAFRLVRDGFTTFKQALSGNWADNPQILGFHRVIGQIGLIIREQVIPAVQQVVGFLSENLPRAIDMARTAISTVATALAPVFGYIIDHKAEVVAGLAGIAIAFGVWTVATTAQAIAMGVLSAAMAPVTLALLAIGAASIGLYKAWQGNWGGIQEKTAAVLGWLQANIPPAFEAVRAAIAGVVGFVSTLIDGDWSSAWSQLGSVVSAAAGVLTGTVLPGLLSAVGSFLSGAVPVIASQLAAWGAQFIGWVGSTVLPQLPGVLASILSGVTGFVLTAAGAIGIALLGWATRFIVWIANDVLPQLPGALGAILSTIGSWVGGAVGTLASEGAKLGLSILEGIASGIRDSAASIVGSAIDFVTGLLPEWVKKGLKIGSPSKVMHDEVGIPISQGIATGMRAGAGEIKLAWDWLFGSIMADAKDYSKQVGAAFEGLFGSISDLASGTSIKNAQAELDRLLTIRQIAIDTGAGEAAVAGIDAQIAEQQNRVQAIGAAMGTDIVRGITDQMQSADLAASLAESVSAAWSASLGNLDSILSGDRIGALQDTLRGLEQQLALALTGGAPEDVVAGIRANIAAVQRELGASQQIYDDAMNAGLIDTSVFQMPLDKISQLLPQMKDGGLSMIDELVRGVADGSASLGGAMATIQGIVAAGSDKLPETIGASVFEVIDVLKELDKSLTVDLAQAFATGDEAAEGIQQNLAIVASLLGDLQAQADATAKSIKGVNAVTGQKIVRPDGRSADSGGSGFESAGGSGGGGTRIGGQTVLMMPDATPLLTWYAYESTQSEALWPVTG